jgi:hypothetical protein
LNVPVTLTVSATPVVTAAPASLAFLFETGGTHNITEQSLTLTSSGAQASFTAAASVNANSANAVWLSVTPGFGDTPADLAVSVTPGALPAGIYSGKITITVPGAATVTVNVTLTVSSSPLLGPGAHFADLQLPGGRRAPGGARHYADNHRRGGELYGGGHHYQRRKLA